MKVTVSKPEFSPVTIVLENKIEALNLLRVLQGNPSFIGTELHSALISAVYD